MKRGGALCVLALVALACRVATVNAQASMVGADDAGLDEKDRENVFQLKQQQEQRQEQERLRRNQLQQEEDQRLQKPDGRAARRHEQNERVNRMYAQASDVENNKEAIARKFLTKEQIEQERAAAAAGQAGAGAGVGAGDGDPSIVQQQGQIKPGGLNPRDYNAMGLRRNEGLIDEADIAGFGEKLPVDVRNRIRQMNEERRAQMKAEERRLAATGSGSGMPDGPNHGARDGVSGMDNQEQEAFPGARHEKAHPFATRFKGEQPPKEMHEYMKSDMFTFKLNGGATETFFEFASPDTERFEIGYVLRGPAHSQLDIVVYAPNGQELHRERGQKYHQMKVNIEFEGAYRVDIVNLYGDEVVVSFGLETNDNIGKEMRAVNEREKELAVDDNLEPIAEVLQRVDVRLADIRKEQRYMLIRERDHQLTQDNTHYRVVVYSVLESVVFVAAAIFQNLWVINLVTTNKPLGGV